MKFLIIDDDASLRSLLKKRVLQKWPGSIIDLHDPVKSGVPDKAYPWTKYDIVFLDFDLGIDNLTGLDLIGNIKQGIDSPKVIMVTGQGGEDIAVKSIKLGATDYLIKYDVVTDRFFDIVEEVIDSDDTGENVMAGPAPDAGSIIHDLQIPGYIFITDLTRGYNKTILAEQEKGGESVILKVQNYQSMHSASLLIKRFTRELNILTEINHPNVVKVLDHGVTEKCAYYAMEYFPLGDMATIIASERITVNQAIDYVTQIANGLHTLHQREIVHRDIKPSNILFRDKHNLVIADLGIAKDLASDEALTLHGEILGTPYYMSVEQLNGLPVNICSDIYSLGIMFYQLLTNELPFTGESIMQVVYKHNYGKPPSLPPEMAELQPIIEKMIAKKPADRFQDVMQFLDALKNIKSD